MRVCVIYDCLYPWTVGGAERWTRRLAEGLAADGHDVTYLTRRQWGEDDAPALPGVRVVAVSPGGELYKPDGTRRFGPPLRFGLGVLRHLLRYRRDYDVVHTASFPFFALLAAAVAFGGPKRVDWHEVWPLAFWREYVGGAAGTVGWLVQRLCLAVPQRAYVFSAMNEGRLRDEGLRGAVVRLPGLYDGPLDGVDPEAAAAQREPLVLAAGRMLAHKRLTLVPGAAARAGVPATVLGDGPERAAVQRAAAGAAVDVDVPGFVSGDELDAALRRATCLVQPSAREGYGMVVVEAAAAGTPSVVVAGPETAAPELVEEGVNGFVVDEPTEEALAAGIRRVHEGGAALRRSTAAWFARRGPELSLAASVARVVRDYRES
ncbi:MAG: glycosyltransferase [Solirubrobacterales bacterium]|nr:glycosyltransferase [Solirubrobacterales bacterium]